MKKYQISEKRALATRSGAKPAGMVVTEEQLNNWGLSESAIEGYLKGGRLVALDVEEPEPEAEPEEEEPEKPKWKF